LLQLLFGSTWSLLPSADYGSGCLLVTAAAAAAAVMLLLLLPALKTA
jgi:hypothetical protein